MRRRDTAGSRLRRAARLFGLALIGSALLAGGAGAKTRVITVKTCGYANTSFGKSAVYPWHMSCAAAKTVVRGSANLHAKTISFGPGWDGAAVRIDGQYWVCVGQMGYDACGYPYRPKTIRGVLGYEGPFTKDVQYRTCVLRPGCPAESAFPQPPG
jgi:hypothetical protein